MYTCASTADDIARELNARREGRHWMARCPAHDDRTPSLSIRQGDDRVLIHCFAGCSQQAVIAALAARHLWSSDVPRVTRPIQRPLHRDNSATRARRALGIWSETVEYRGTLAERYLMEQRGLNVRSLQLDHVLRWHTGIGALVAVMTDPVTGKLCGIHRTFLDADGRKIERKMLGQQGVVRLSSDDQVTGGLGLTEGIEDALAILLCDWAPVWAATSAGAIARFPVLSGIGGLTVFADTDAPGTTAAEMCAARWQAAGRDVRISHPRELAHA